jgi:hypothetical protein
MIEPEKERPPATNRRTRRLTDETKPYEGFFMINLLGFVHRRSAHNRRSSRPFLAQPEDKTSKVHFLPISSPARYIYVPQYFLCRYGIPQSGGFRYLL